MLTVQREGRAFVRFYFLYFCALGAFMPYWGPWLKAHGQSALAIGVLTAAVQFSKVLAPNVWGWLQQRRPQMPIVPVAAGVTAVGFLALSLAGNHFWALLLITLTFAFFWAATLPLVDAAAMAWTLHHGRAYGRIRLWGSLGFIALALGMGGLIWRWGMAAFLPSIAGFLLLAWWSSRRLPAAPQSVAHIDTTADFIQVLGDWRLWYFLAAGVLEQASHGVYYAFYSIFVENHGYSSLTVGLLWAFAVLCEVGFFWLGDRWIGRWGVPLIFSAAFLLTTLRWALIGLWPGFAIIVALQVLHAASYGAFHLAAVHWVYGRFPGGLRARGMALYASLVYGLGGGLGALGAGWAWQHWGGMGAFLAAAGLSAAGSILLFGVFWRPRMPLENLA